MNRGSGKLVWVLGGSLFAGAMILAAWLVFANHVDTTGLTDLAHWTPRHITHDPEGFVLRCRQQLSETCGRIAAAAAPLDQSRASAAALQSEIEPRLRVAAQKRSELRAVYQWAESANHWPVRYGDRDMDRRAVQCSLVSATRYMQALRQTSTAIPQTLSAIDARQKALAGCRDSAAQTLRQFDALPRLATPLPQETLDQLVQLGGQIQSLQQSVAQLGEGAALQLPPETPAASVDEQEFARVLAENP
jgi:hypothetical protein